MFDWLPSFSPLAIGALLPIAGWIGLGSGIGVGLFVIAALLPAPLGWLRKWIVIAGAFASAATFTYVKGTNDGAARVHAQWAAAEQYTAEQGAKARARAERRTPPAQSRAGARGRKHGERTRRLPAQPRDPYDRDNP